MREVKLDDSSVKQAMERMNQTIQSLDPTIPQNVKGKNALDVVEKLHAITQTLEDVVKQYQDLTIQNLESTRGAVEALKESEKQAADAIGLLR
ncbi:YwqI/YxiC family protein [Oceanobacillus saliphilus]|uniref:YwqI/YxiC family protein n=1 Tax=Oceanobacillus saliphilus TaxID=2925834 RepID=UPI00201E503D|nr:YwqI/YxiC family protein [Oceanobacillus saliphilus]